MPFFETDDAKALRTENLNVDATIDLSGLGVVEGLARVEEALLALRGPEERRVLFAFPPPSPGGGETLFLPVGRRLWDAVRRGEAVRAMPAEGGGWIARLTARVD